MTDKLNELRDRARYMVNNPSAWDTFDQGASDTISDLLAAFTPAGEDEVKRVATGLDLLQDSARKLAPICAELGRDTPRAGENDPRWWERQSALAEAGRVLGFIAALSRPNVDEMREALHEIDVIASNTIPPDGKDAAFAALNEIIKLINPFRRAALNGSGNHG